MKPVQLSYNSDAIQTYQASPVTQYARDMRGNNGDFSGVNYATFWYVTPYGNGQVTRASNTYHSEKEAWLALCQAAPIFKALRVQSWKAGSFGGTLNVVQLYQQQG